LSLDFGEGLEIINNVEDVDGDGTLRIKVWYNLMEF